tara:strand:- start:465 stop:713 length:249 start_codon:yes stop_codon:yes gene_type:complete
MVVFVEKKTCMITFLHATTAGDPVWICEDVRRHILALSRMQHCTRCAAVVSTGRRTDRVRLCVTAEGTLCFRCAHRVRWPKE